VAGITTPGTVWVPGEDAAGNGETGLVTIPDVVAGTADRSKDVYGGQTEAQPQMYREILVPTDGSESIETVLDHTVAVAGDRDASVHVLYVIDDRAFLTLDDGMKEEVEADLHEKGAAAVRQVAARLETEDLATTTAIATGKPSDEITSYVEREGIDLVTMGTRGDEYTNNILGSTAQTVVAEAPAPVLTVNVAGE